MTEDWNRLDGCDASITQANGWCKYYACALSFPKCNSFGDAPLGICRCCALVCRSIVVTVPCMWRLIVDLGHGTMHVALN